MDGEPLPGRECDGCNVCCVALTIDEPELQKPQGYRCRNALPDNRCSIYSTRPDTCRRFNCGWRLLRWVRPTLRPDRSGVLIRLHGHPVDGLGIIVTLLNRAALKADGLAETVAAAVAAGRPVYLHVPGPPGYTSGRARIDAELAGPVAAKNKAAVLDFLRQALRLGRDSKPVPIRFNSVPAGDDAPPGTEGPIPP